MDRTSVTALLRALSTMGLDCNNLVNSFFGSREGEVSVARLFISSECAFPDNYTDSLTQKSSYNDAFYQAFGGNARLVFQKLATTTILLQNNK